MKLRGPKFITPSGCQATHNLAGKVGSLSNNLNYGESRETDPFKSPESVGSGSSQRQGILSQLSR